MNTDDKYIEEELLKFAEAVSEEQGVEVIEVKVTGRNNRFRLKVTVDKENGVTLDDCAEFSRKIDRLIEENNVIQGFYNLEVSSPGLDRPLITAKDFERITGKIVRIITKEKINSQDSFRGKISGIEADSIILTLEDKEIAVPLNNISKARLEIEIR